MASLVAVAGCKKPESASETQQDMAAAEAEGQQKVDEARAEAAQDINAARQEETQTTIESAGNSNPADAAANNMGAHTDTMKTEAEGRYKVESAEIEAAYKVEKERCDASTGSARDTCLNQAKTDYERKLSEAKNRRDSIRGALDGNSVARP
ncbi:MAG TPA: hypothetical protein VLI06_14900 [Solimonas sp.]|nr:hypothetical protein [Solimonas sp.]